MIENASYSDIPIAVRVENKQDAIINNITVINSHYGLFIDNNRDIFINDYVFVGGSISQEYEFSAGISLAINRNVYIDNANISNMHSEVFAYGVTNWDGIVADSGDNLYIKNSSLYNLGDGCIDSKINVYANNCSFSNSHHCVRCWGNTVHYYANCDFSNWESGAIAIHNPLTSVYIYNCTFNGLPIDDSMIYVTDGAAKNQVTVLTESPDFLNESFFN